VSPLPLLGGVICRWEPCTLTHWIFYSSDEPLDRLSQLKGKRIAVGPVGSGTRFSVERLLGRSGVDFTTATLLPSGGTAAVAAHNEGKADVVWTAGPPDAPTLSSLLRNPKVRLMSFPMADAFTRVFPDLVRLVLPQGVIDLDNITPPNDVVLIELQRRCWCVTIFIHKLSNFSCRQWRGKYLSARR
jgi:NMT1-like family